jgi:hypothetical protein
MVQGIKIIPDYRVQGADLKKRNTRPARPEDGTHMPKHVVVDSTD